MKRALFLILGFVWLLFALGFGFVLVQYIREGAGLQCYAWMFSSGSVLVGLVHVLGFVFAAFICFAIGIGLLARGVVGTEEETHAPELNKT